MKKATTKAKSKKAATNKRLNTLLKKLPPRKVQEVLDFADFLLSRVQRPPKVQKLGDRFAGVWKDDRSAEEIIADIRNSRINTTDREEL